MDATVNPYLHLRLAEARHQPQRDAVAARAHIQRSDAARRTFRRRRRLADRLARDLR